MNIQSKFVVLGIKPVTIVSLDAGDSFEDLYGNRGLVLMNTHHENGITVMWTDDDGSVSTSEGVDTTMHVFKGPNICKLVNDAFEAMT